MDGKRRIPYRSRCPRRDLLSLSPLDPCFREKHDDSAPCFRENQNGLAPCFREIPLAFSSVPFITIVIVVVKSSNSLRFK